jgi:hypothetical protein
MRPYDVEPDYYNDLMQSRNFISKLEQGETNDEEQLEGRQEFLKKTLSE